jgi:hypothetical protein
MAGGLVLLNSGTLGPQMFLPLLSPFRVYPLIYLPMRPWETFSLLFCGKDNFFSRRIWSPRVRRFFVGLKTQRRAQERERGAARAAAEAKRAEAERKARADAQKVVAVWNARQAGVLPNYRCGHRGGAAVAFVRLPGLRPIRVSHLRTLDRHPGDAISGLIPSLSCRRCSPHAPFARLEMLMAERP